MVREQLSFPVEPLHGFEKGLERRGVRIRRGVAQLPVNLRQRRASQATASQPQIDQHEYRLTAVGAQLGRERAAHVGHRSKSRDDERHRGRHFLARAVLVPGRFHGKAVLADRNAHPQCGTQLHRNRAHRVKQRGVLARVTGRRHPVRRELHLPELGDRRGGDIGNGLPDRHAPRRFRADEGKRRPFPHGKGLAAAGVESHQRNRHIGYGNLPRPNHLIACRKAAHRAIADGDEKRFVPDGWKPQYAIGGLAQLDPGALERGKLALLTHHRSRHSRRFSEHDSKIHVDRVVAEKGVRHL